MSRLIEESHDVDVIIPFHIHNQLLHQAINSVLESVGVSARIILVNDTGLEISRNHLPIRSTDLILSTEVRGYSSALTRGICEVSAKYVAFLDSDDLIHPNKLALQIQKLEFENLDLVSSKIVKINSSGKVLLGRPLLGEIPREHINPFD